MREVFGRIFFLLFNACTVFFEFNAAELVLVAKIARG
jgi:hypothetical protein